MPKYLCSYCDAHLNFDSQSSRKQHNRGRKHQENVRGYYALFAAALATANRGLTSGTPITCGITLFPPPPPTAGGLTRPSGSSGAPFHPYASPSSAGPPNLSIRALGPVPNMPGPPRPAPPSQFAPSAYQQTKPVIPGGGGGYQSTTYARPGGSLPPPPFGAPQQPPQHSAPAPSATSSAAAASGAFVNPDRMRALGLQGHH